MGFYNNKKDIIKAVQSKCFEPKPIVTKQTKQYHIQRIAYFVVHGWNDLIDIDVGVPSLGYVPEWIIQDGNHRCAAAIIRGDQTIKASFSGDIKYCFELLNIPKEIKQ